MSPLDFAKMRSAIEAHADHLIAGRLAVTGDGGELLGCCALGAMLIEAGASPAALERSEVQCACAVGVDYVVLLEDAYGIRSWDLVACLQAANDGDGLTEALGATPIERVRAFLPTAEGRDG